MVDRKELEWVPVNGADTAKGTKKKSDSLTTSLGFREIEIPREQKDTSLQEGPVQPTLNQRGLSNEQNSLNSIQNAQTDDQNSPNFIKYLETEDQESESVGQFFFIDYTESITIEEDFVNKEEEFLMQDDKPLNCDQDFLWKEKDFEQLAKESPIAEHASQPVVKELPNGEQESYSGKENPIPLVEFPDSDNYLLNDQDSQPVIKEPSIADNYSDDEFSLDDQESMSLSDNEPLIIELMGKDLLIEEQEEDVLENDENPTSTQSQCTRQASGFQSQPNFNVSAPRVRKRPMRYSDNNLNKKYARQHSKYHLEQQKNKNKFYCKLCQRFILVANKELHANQHVKAGSKFTCETCQKVFISKVNLRKHSLSHGEAQYPCQNCSRKFVCKSNLKVHVAKMHSAQGSFPCLLCRKMFISELSLIHHQNYKCTKKT